MSRPKYQEVEHFNDCTGRAVRRGDEVVYPVRVSSSLWMKQGRVTNIEYDPNHRYNPWKISVKVPGGTRDSYLEAVERIVKVRSNKEIELAEREAEARAHPQVITFGEKAYDV